MLGKTCCTLSVLAKPAKVEKIIGLEEIKKFPEVVAITQWYQEGDTIAPEALGTQKQISMRITLEADNLQKLADVINRVYRTVDVLDENGESILIEQFDTARLFE